MSDTAEVRTSAEFVSPTDRARMVDEAFLSEMQRNAEAGEVSKAHMRFVESHYKRQTDALETIATALLVISSHYIEGCDEHE